MGSRLKGKRVRKSTQRERKALIKVLLYGLLGLGVVALLWVLWLSDKGLQVARDLKTKAPAGDRSGGP